MRAIRYHDFSAGHRVVGHENKCKHLHGHNYRVTFEIQGNLDKVGRVLDFGVIKEKLCKWLEDNWDHKMILWVDDPMMLEIRLLDEDGVCIVPFNPTAENMAQYLVQVVGPTQLLGTGTELVKCIIEETRKCSVSYEAR